MDGINQQPTASSSSAALPAAIYTNRASAVPSLPTPEVDKTSLLDFVLSRTSFSDDLEPVGGHAKEVQKLESEKALLDKQLQELQRRLEAAEKKGRALEEKRRSTPILPGSGADKALHAGGSR
ncbi:hypothetical protein FRC04_004106 [Tulasnella sp. 424]|nr:hypothetical protein FRC04_004106 [Tulasnella sp. 424]KAG8967654.1 hypothetical protein FRC05_001986 [Tulasnella sp. 425]